MQNLSRKTLFITNALTCVVALGLVAYIVSNNPSTSDLQATRDTATGNKFTSPILDCENVKMDQVSIISESVEHRVTDLERQYGLDFASVYYRDLFSGQWIGVNEKEPFAAASLIKIPVLMSLFKEFESNPSIFDKKVVVSDSDIKNAAPQDIKPKVELQAGATYSMRELAERMIEDSDNPAMTILLRNIDEKDRTGIFEAVGVKFRQEDGDIMVSVKDYAGFFRVLFNASFLSRQSSEQALDMLSQSKFSMGIVAGVPVDVTVAHKFGERTNYVNGILANRQLHDCGIVYYPNKPYILCVMTRGDDFGKQESFISQISKLFYDQVDGKDVL